MDKNILQSETPSERRQILKDSCVKIQEFTYAKEFTKDELASKKDELSQQDIKLDKLEEEKKEITQEFNANIKKLKTERKTTLSCVRTGKEEVTEDVYLLDEQDEGVMRYYNQDGVLVYSRPLLPNERQLRISKTFTGTNN